jgi:glycosyltransferase involved in cell wall biosynthesis
MTELICVINNYNYSRYLEECIDSALSQTLPFDKVIIVDDGSTDNSPEIIRRYQDLNSKVIPILKTNGGQLSCFNAAVEYISEDSQVFLLDSDDIFPKNYLEVLSQRVSLPVDFCFVTAVDFNDVEQLQDANISEQENIIFSKTSALVAARGVWIGNLTSTISVSGVCYKKILPYPFIEDWRSRADDVFVYISSLIGAKKINIPSVGVAYRKHHSSDSNKNDYSSNEIIQYKKSTVPRLFNFYYQNLNIPKPSFSEILPEYNSLSQGAKDYLKRLGFSLF